MNNYTFIFTFYLRLGGTEGLDETVVLSFKFLRRRWNVCDKEQAQMPEGSEFHTEGAAMLKLREAKVVWTRGTDNRLVLEECRERAGTWWLRREWR